MSVSGVIEENGEGIVYVHSGTMSGKELPQKTREHYQNFDTTKLRYQIMDFRAVDRIEMSSKEIRETARLFCKASKSRRPDHKFAIVISNDPMFAVMKLWETYLDAPDVHGKIFYSMEEARAWIMEDIDLKAHQA
jgi:hypothetical protein